MNRHQRRLEARRKRVQPTPTLGHHYWFRRIIIEMQGNPEIQAKIADGKFDTYLK